MSTLTRRPLLRWLIPLLAALVLGAGGSVAGMIAASARGSLPHRSAAQLLVDVQKARLGGLSGTIVQNADLGLPSLPGVGGSGSSDLTSLVSGSHTLRLWYAGPQRVRLALEGSLGESDVVRNGTDLWTWSSSAKSATHRSLPAGAADHAGAPTLPMTPQQAADAALKAVSPSTKVTTDGTAVVAGRSAYQLLLTPRESQSLVGSVAIALDSRTHVPLRVRVFPRGSTKPAFEVGFTSFEDATPASSEFGFNPPPGTKVTQSSSSPSAHRRAAGSATGSTPQGGAVKPGTPAAAGEPTVTGTGWTSVVVAKIPATGSSTASPLAGSGSLTQVLKALPTVHGAWGSGHVLQGSLFSAVLTDDGRVAIGAVAPGLLYAALARP